MIIIVIIIVVVVLLIRLIFPLSSRLETTNRVFFSLCFACSFHLMLQKEELLHNLLPLTNRFLFSHLRGSGSLKACGLSAAWRCILGDDLFQSECSYMLPLEKLSRSK